MSTTVVCAFYEPDNEEIPPVPHYIPEKEGRYDDECRKHPPQMLMAHSKFRFHGKYNDISWLAENYEVVARDWSSRPK